MRNRINTFFSLVVGVLCLLLMAGEAQAQAGALHRTSAGLIARDDFTSLSAWGNPSGKWTASSSPALIPFDPSPMPLLAPGGPGTADYDGVREAQLFVDNDAASTWWLLYDAGDGATGWREFLASSTDRGRTWKKQGPVSINLSNGAGGSYAAVANGWLIWGGDVFTASVPMAANGPVIPATSLNASASVSLYWGADPLAAYYKVERSVKDGSYRVVPDYGSAFVILGTLPSSVKRPTATPNGPRGPPEAPCGHSTGGFFLSVTAPPACGLTL